jgi:hypothetical protein
MNSNLARVVQTIYKKTPIEGLFKFGIEYAQFFLLVNEAVERGYLAYGDKNGKDDLIVTTSGQAFIAASKIASRGKAEWIAPLDNERINSLGVDEVYVPRLITIRKLKN